MGGVGRFSQAKSSTVLDFTGMADCFSRTLTTGSDVSGVLLGSAGTTSYDGADTFNATSATYGSTDLLLGGAGNDVLNIAATAAVGPASIVVGIETING